MRFGTLRMPLDQTALFNFTSTRTSDVFIIFCAKVLIWFLSSRKKRRERVSTRFRERDAEVNEKKSEKKQPRLSLFGVIGNFCLSRGPTYELKKTNAKRDEEQRRGRNQHTREHKYTPRAFPPPIPRRVFRETHPASRISRPHFSSFPPKKLGNKSALGPKTEAHFGAKKTSEITSERYVPPSPRAELSS